MKKLLAIIIITLSLALPTFAQEQNEVPSVSNIETTSPLPGVIEITWKTSFNTSGCIKYGKATINEEQVCNQSLFTTGDHFIRIEELDPGAKYLFQIVAINALGQEFNTITLSFNVRDENIIIDQVFITPHMRTANIIFVTDYPCITTVDYGEKNMAGYESVEELSAEDDHLIILPELIQDTLYRYRIKCMDKDDISGSFPADSTQWNQFKTLVDPDDVPQQEILTLEEQQIKEEETIHDRRLAVIKRERIQTINPDADFTRNLSGRILLQVEEHGEAWYVSPTLQKRIYLADGNDAQALLREEGQGITNSDLKKIPVDVSTHIPDADRDKDGLSDRLEIALGTDQNLADTDGDGFDDKTELLNGFDPLGPGRGSLDLDFAKQQGGKIFLQVQENGEAWYINPDTGLRYYLGTSDDAYQVMRQLSLGISNTDIRKIDVLQ